MKAIKEAARDHSTIVEEIYKIGSQYCTLSMIKHDSFISGAEWQKERAISAFCKITCDCDYSKCEKLKHTDVCARLELFKAMMNNSVE